MTRSDNPVRFMVVVTNMRMLTTETVTSVDKIRNENRYGCLLENILFKGRLA